MKTWITGVISLNLIQDGSRAIHVHKQREQSCVRFIHLEFASFITKTDNIKCSFYHQMENSTKLGGDFICKKDHSVTGELSKVRRHYKSENSVGSRNERERHE